MVMQSVIITNALLVIIIFITREAFVDCFGFKSHKSLLHFVHSHRMASNPLPFNDYETDFVIKSLQNLATDSSNPTFTETDEAKRMKPSFEDVDWASLRTLLHQVAHLPHKDWTTTDTSSEALRNFIGDPSSNLFCRMFQRVLEDGNWAGAEVEASSRSNDPDRRPWVVLVTGLNGIRKTTSMYQSWFPQVLKHALGVNYEGSLDDLPCGENSFFRQLDYMIVSLVNEEFRNLYSTCSLDDVTEYSRQKDKIFVRYRTLAEMLGILLVRRAQAQAMNVMVETSGRDVASFKYIDHLFPDSPTSSYRKLVIHFKINEIAYAERSVDQRMLREISTGLSVVAKAGTVQEVVQVNQGGPYGSEVLKKVQEDSDAVWDAIQTARRDRVRSPAPDPTTEGGTQSGGGGGGGGSGSGSAGLSDSWLMAAVSIHAHDDQPWTAQGISPDGEPGELFAFE